VSIPELYTCKISNILDWIFDFVNTEVTCSKKTACVVGIIDLWITVFCTPPSLPKANLDNTNQGLHAGWSTSCCSWYCATLSYHIWCLLWFLSLFVRGNWHAVSQFNNSLVPSCVNFVVIKATVLLVVLRICFCTYCRLGCMSKKQILVIFGTCFYRLHVLLLLI